MERTNHIRLVGTVTEPPAYCHSIYGEEFYKLTLAAVRLSGTEDVLPVTVSSRLLGNRDISADTKLEVLGQVRSYNQRSEDASHLMITVFARELYLLGERGPELDRNEVELYGHICKPVIYRTTPFSREIADVLVAVNRRYMKSDYLPAIAWGRNARFARELVCGDPVLIRGRLQSREYQKMLPDGEAEQRTAYEISCSSIEKVD